MLRFSNTTNQPIECIPAFCVICKATMDSPTRTQEDQDDNEENKEFGKNFSFINDNIRIVAGLKLMQWCPSMDLLCVVNEEGQLSVHRLLTWQKLFSIASNSNCTVSSITWSPNGDLIHPSAKN